MTKKIICNCLFSVLILVGIFMNSTDAVYSVANKDDTGYGGTFYNDVSGSETTYLGAANYFHIFANKINLKNHTNGNIATRKLSGDANFGTQGIEGTEINYVQKVKQINAASGIKNHTKMIFGKDTSIDLTNFDRPLVENVSLDRLSGDDIYQDKYNLPEYICFDSEFSNLSDFSYKIINNTTKHINVSNSDFSDVNKREIDVSNINSSNVYIHLDPDVLIYNTPLTLKGIEKNDGKSSFKNIYLIIDVGSYNNYIINSEIKFEYTDGSYRGNKETTNFTDSTVLWTFSKDMNVYNGDIFINSTWLGSILAPKAKLEGSKNIDGNIIVNEFLGAGETHKWDWQPPLLKKGSVKLIKVDSDNEDKYLEGAEFSLYKSNGVLVKEHLKTNKEGIVICENLETGDYYFKETKAPDGYKLIEQHFPFSKTEESSLKTIEILVSNKKETTEPSTTEPSTTEPSTTEPSKNNIFISSTDNDKYLPKTGEKKSFLLIVLGSLMILVGILTVFKNKKNLK
ncbi:SpaA isopeptide-forming pilin-related protein [Enterococcus sp. AZ126]|uniref:SpaA isopeptide-forming pilin-related protein n=1 Tax=Enterococcus sp. AZ126 TaxID=2774635 RepID=UPI003F28358A